MNSCAFLVIFPLLSLPWSQAWNILVFSVDGSYWLNMKLLIDGLHARGHNITVVRSSTSWHIKEKCPQYTSIKINLPEDPINGRHDFLEAFLYHMLDIHWGEGSLRATISFYWSGPHGSLPAWRSPSGSPAAAPCSLSSVVRRTLWLLHLQSPTSPPPDMQFQARWSPFHQKCPYGEACISAPL